MPNQQGCSNGGEGGTRGGGGHIALNCNKTAFENEIHTKFHMNTNPSFEHVSVVTTVIQIVDL